MKKKTLRSSPTEACLPAIKEEALRRPTFLKKSAREFCRGGLGAAPSAGAGAAGSGAAPELAASGAVCLESASPTEGVAGSPAGPVVPAVVTLPAETAGVTVLSPSETGVTVRLSAGREPTNRE